MATRAVFLVAGVVVSSLAPLILYVKDRLRADDGRLGLLLLCLGGGSVIGMPLAGRYGCRAVIVSAALLAVGMLPVLAMASHAIVLAVGLLCFWAGGGSLDVTMNLYAVLVKRQSGRTMTSGFHGLYSVGGIAGAGLVGLLVWFRRSSGESSPLALCQSRSTAAAGYTAR